MSVFPLHMSDLPLRPFIKVTPANEVVELPPSHLGTMLTVKGVLDTDGEIFVDGKVMGRISASRLVLNANGYVEGDVIARDVVLCGRMAGRVFAFNVTLDSSADITGRIFHHTVTIAKGARMNGRMPWRPLSYFETLKQLPENRP